MATGQKITAQTVATSFDSGDLMTIVQSGTNKSVDHDILMDDTQILKAWVNFNGTGVVAIRDDFNVSSITDNNTGDYDINLTNAMSDTNFSIGSDLSAGAGTKNRSINSAIVDTSTIRVITTTTSTNTETDVENIYIQIFGS